MTGFRTSQRLDGFKVLKYYERRCQGIKRGFKKRKHTKKHINKDVKNSENSELKP